jgi:tetratricopeptide (TPR) repeat protein
MSRTFAAVASAVLVCAFTTVAVEQTDEELRQLYVRSDFARMEQIAQAGDARAEAWMGLIRQNAGRREEAKVWYRRAAEKNNPWGISQLAEMHDRDGESAQALYWYRRGAESGNPNDQVALAWRLRKGSRGFPLDPHEAYRWYAAAAQRYDAAYLALAELKAAGFGTERNGIEAYAFAEIAETVRGDSGETTATRAKELKEQLAVELWPHEVMQAERRARELRPELDEIKGKQKRDDFLFPFVVLGFLLAPIVILWLFVWILWQFVRWILPESLRTDEVVECPPERRL